MNRIIKHVLLIISAFFLLAPTALGEDKNMDNVTAQDTLNAVISDEHNGFIIVGEKGTIFNNQANKGWTRQESGTDT